VRLILLGPPGVGKGTQGRRLSQVQGWALISTGEMLREAGTRGTPLGLEARRRMDAGQLVSDAIMIGLVRERTALDDASKGFVLDGFPRTVPQAEALDALLEERGQRLDAVVSLNAPESELVRRLSDRRECPVCKRAYNRGSSAPKNGAHCDDHPEVELKSRADDAPETVRERLKVYRDQTAPLIDYYGRCGRLLEVTGLGEPDAVFRTMQEALAARQQDR